MVDQMGRTWGRTRSRPPQEWTDLELTMPQARTLIFLGEGTKRMSDIAAYLERGTSAATTMIDRLVKKGLVERVEDASDRRVVACRLTPLGIESVDLFLRFRGIKTERLANAMTEDELQIVIRALEIMAEAADRQEIDAPIVPDRPVRGVVKAQQEAVTG